MGWYDHECFGMGSIEHYKRALDAIVPRRELPKHPKYDERTQRAIDEMNAEMDAAPVSLEAATDNFATSMRYIRAGCRSAFEKN
ncbi:hypothetical protein FJZ28_04635 [Candidatus Peregrinibacteria bacterium]|nr:hypothetical protein [Candidatus Peregrinibacteria bacterium]